MQPEKRPPRFEGVLENLGAFYHGLAIKLYTPALCFESCESTKRKGASTPYTVALKEGPTDSLTGIRPRPSLEGIFLHQLNLSDLLDFAIQILPKDAYALLLAVDQDLYDDEEDEFCRDRAYGGSHVAVVSSAPYNPLFYGHESVDVRHIWLASHCAAYVESQSQVADISGAAPSRGRKRLRNPESTSREDERRETSSGSSIHQGHHCDHYHRSHHHPRAMSLLSSAHGLPRAHCFCMDHCLYYACCMQGTASVAEDCRQPPYVCPHGARNYCARPSRPTVRISIEDSICVGRTRSWEWFASSGSAWVHLLDSRLGQARGCAQGCCNKCQPCM
ncbi:hypothetical protein BD289DRAFT_430847 [Coniella lustricola]|uniref:Uncharacterized protein n=1 Tax=Coniella lustricola TaxID=2025994 RepID=A0A2T3ABF3_9PEZI|nr:hypothetical protein BD289DRAFT_430847 [Coniella lustricola]